VFSAVILKYRFDEQAHRVVSEIGGDVSDFEPSLG
jgi:hypothetical protein